ncbi:MAG: CDP-diacylglycerol--glycerol-3-phosphate 3-phosphatidyltransferase [Candidatus Omnitrophota bacterium]|jgi:CDP-diacylglycerol--glycerol-3-phosphate 3-phosphatidyltransferase|nr:CDP-diacylglycerol--glycerol-3-phosphate 3-phosphatidyltransferase [Candidatus Omnitrophota bacterium]MDD3982465.1 CDP-diacylglycerol--glycerol-3-phosphate 3-phosphatidyltransferase [Candidatus Omnitrophota bacterium]MDD5526731.1 CDP-diacylglycerol--glycerol-3-phosphate 3-phosphatidyltransferase [Candidatus Omnitrophota bacterium]NLE92193.1 CDP-diacylglycerol--glycerol-3-phosphate 3-phosphatidyltransferase [Elusimicrobiota bacterium]
MNLANRLTVLRIVFTFVFMFFLFIHGLWAKVISLVIFALAAVSDFLDGRIAQKRNMVTDFGKLMDPIADKILVLAAFAAFVQMQLVDAWMFVIIISREILITSLRLFALNKGKVLSAAKAGKHKTVSQMSVIVLILIFVVLKEMMLTFFTWNPSWESFFRQGIYVLMVITVGLTLYSGLYYLWENRRIITKL